MEHNIALSAADHVSGKSDCEGVLLCLMKATELMKCCANNIVTSTAARLQTGPFVVGMDGSQEGGEKCYLMLVWYVTTNGEIITELITNLTCAEPSTGENIFQLMNKTSLLLNGETVVGV